MNIAFLIYGLSSFNVSLMPWRYVLEIAKGIIDRGHSVTIITDGTQHQRHFLPNLPPIRMANGPFQKSNGLYRQYMRDFRPDVVYFPIARRSALGKIPDWGEASSIAYFPSAWYEPKSTLRICRDLSLWDAVTYSVESLVPAKWIVRALGRKGIQAVTTVTAYTADRLVKGGWAESRIKAFSPGVYPRQNLDVDSKIFRRFRQKLEGKRYLLFMGPAKAIRGIYVLLKAFDRASLKARDMSLVCLLRGGAGQDRRKLNSVLGVLQNRHRVCIVEDRLEREDVMCFIEGSHAVALPFLLVPSEIPVAVLEALSLDKPVLISETGGTSQYIGKAGIVVPPNDVKALAEAIVKICTDRDLYATMCQEARELMSRQSSWARVAADYLDFSQLVLGASSECEAS